MTDRFSRPSRPSRPRRLLTTLVLAATTAFALVPALTVAAPPAAAASGPRFGMATHLLWETTDEARSDLDRMQRAGMTYVRFDVSWRSMQPSRGTFRYLTKLDALLNAIQARGMRLTMTVIETPGWANGGRGPWTPPSSMGDYARFVGRLAARYAGRTGMVYEIWNEPNDWHSWRPRPSVARYTTMLKAAFKSIKAADPDATVLGGSILANDLAFLRGIYANGGGRSFNGLAIHPYCGSRPPADTSSSWFSFQRSVPQFRKVMASHGGVKPIWITEMGWSTDRVTDATRAGYMATAVSIARGWSGVRAMAAYTLHQSQFRTYGLLRTDGTATDTWTGYAAALP
jgi:hypothetical protein